MKNYFVTVGGLEVASNLTKQDAIKIAIKRNKPNTGVGYIRKKGYILLPLHFYID